MIHRRTLIKGMALGGVLAASGCMTTSVAPKVVVVGGGFGGATAARTLKAEAPELDVTLLEPKTSYFACPFSNLVVANFRQMSAQRFEYAALAKEGIHWLPEAAKDIDPVTKRVVLGDGRQLNYDRLILAPGISFDYASLPGYSEAAAKIMPHAWQAGEQTLLLQKQLQAMDDGGLVVMSIPANPYRCPPGPYERASLICAYLKKFKPRSKVLLLDGKDQFSKQTLFQQAWQEFFPGMIEWQGLSDGGAVISVDASSRQLSTDFDRVQAVVANIIPPQKAGEIAQITGIADATGWCPVNAQTFESTLAPDVHVIGDAAILNAMPKSAFAANAQAKLCATQIVRDLRGLGALDVTLANTCYSLVKPDYGISVAGVYKAEGERWLSIPGSGGTSPVGAEHSQRQLEAGYARDWFRTITQEAFL